MLQRIQTIYLLLVVACLALVFAFPFATYQIGKSIYVFDVLGLEIDGQNHIKFPYYVSVSLSAGLALFTISRFKNRTLQMRLGRYNYLILLLTIAMSFVNVRTIEDLFPDAEVQTTYGAGLFLPVAALAFLFLANRAIKRDEQLIKSIERIR